MKPKGYISIESAIREFKRKLPPDTVVDKSNLLAFANEALDRIIPAEEYVQQVVLLPVRDYKAELPDNFKAITQIAFRETCPKDSNPRIEISQLTQNLLGSDCNLKIDLECPSCGSAEVCGCKKAIVTVEADRLFQMNNPQLYHSYAKHFYGYGTMTPGLGYSSQYHPDFRLIRHTSSSFFNVPYHISECINLNLDSNIEYSLDPPNIIINVKEGEILLSYMGAKTDENGYRLIPDDDTVMRAVVFSMLEKHIHMDYISSNYEMNKLRAWEKHNIEADKWIARARTRLQTPSFDDLHDFVTGFIFRVVPKRDYWQDLMRRRPDSFRYPGETYNHKGYRA